MAQHDLCQAADAPGYPTTVGSDAVRAAAADWLARSLDVVLTDADRIIPSIGSKEMVALLPTLLGLGPDDRVVIPTLAYPTYDVGARLAGCQVVVSDDVDDIAGASLVWINSPSNPTGGMHTAAEQRALLTAAREAGAVVASDECYAEFAWEGEHVSMLHPKVCGTDRQGVISLHSLSKRSNMAGYRFGFLAGDQALVTQILQVRKHLGLLVPSPIQAAAVAALNDDEHVQRQREVYLHRRAILRTALQGNGFRIDHSQAGLYLWATRGENCWQTAAALAAEGILVTPGDFYGSVGAEHVRVCLTAPDVVIDRAAERLGGRG
jgi:succinyldiaminopimelate transaminase